MDLCFADRDPSAWEIFQVNQRIFTFVQDAWWPNWSYWAALPEQTWANPRHFYAVRVYGFNQQAADFLLEGFICKPFCLRDPSLWCLERSHERGEVPAVRACWV